MSKMTIKDCLLNVLLLFRPFLLLGLSLSFLPRTLFDVFLTPLFEMAKPIRSSTTSSSSSPQIPPSWSTVREIWFARFWTYFGPLSAMNLSPLIQPMLQEHASGVVLDIGSGQGHFLHLYPKDQITKIYAVEPNKSHHKELLLNARKAGLLEPDAKGNVKFEILNTYIENLSEPPTSLARESINTITTLMVLCSIPNQELLIPELRSYLKPQGQGKWIVFEHVRRPEWEDRGEDQGMLVLWQKCLNLVWPKILNGCELTRRTKGLIEENGGWKKGEDRLKYLEDEGVWTVLPSVTGVLVTA